MSSVLRTVASALLILLGGLLIVTWSVSEVAVRAVEDGTAVYGIAEDALADPELIDALGDQVADEAVAALQERGVDTGRLGLEVALRLLIDGAVQSDAFHDALLDQVASVQDQFATALTDSLRDPQPLVLEIDVSGYVNRAVDSLPLVGESVPDVTLAALEIEAMDQAAFESVRSAYAVLAWLAVWGVWCGIALIGLGMVVTHRFRWFLAKTGLAVAVFAGAGWLVLRWWGVDAIARLVPGEGGAVSDLLTEVLTDAAVPLISARLTTVALVAAAVALVALLIAVLTRPRATR